LESRWGNENAKASFVGGFVAGEVVVENCYKEEGGQVVKRKELSSD
jgi:hypothetical protein